MKRFYLSLFAGILCLGLVTGCGEKKKETEDNKKDEDITDNVENNEEPTPDIVIDEKTYHCYRKDDNNVKLDFYYSDDKLKAVEHAFLSTSDEDYNKSKQIIDNYDGVEIEKTSDGFIKIMANIGKDGLNYLKDNHDFFKELEDTDFKTVSALLKTDYKCSLSTIHETISGNIK